MIAQLAIFRRRLIVSGLLMLSGIGIVIATTLRASSSLWWTRAGALLVVIGACVELIAVSAFAGSRDRTSV